MMGAERRTVRQSEFFSTDILRDDLPWGARVNGLRMEDLDDPRLQDDVRALFADEGVILFENSASTEGCLKLSEMIGPLRVHPAKDVVSKDQPAFTYVNYEPETGWMFEVGGERVGNFQPWHKDLIYVDKINRGGILKPVVIPSRLGHTSFIDGIEAYERLPQALRDRIEGLHVVYQYDIDVGNQKFGLINPARVLRYSAVTERVRARSKEFPEVLHPMVYTQPETGRKVLNVSPYFALRIFEMPNAEGDRLLEEIAQHTSDERFAYQHTWKLTDMILWDNWRMLHSATGCPADEQRTFERTTIGGDYGFGRINPEAAEATASDYVHM
jgi:taurine dioxygenase